MAVVTPRKFDEFIAPGIPARKADGGHRRLRSGIDKADALHIGRRKGDLLGELRFAHGGRAEREPLPHGLLHRRNDLCPRMPEDERSPAHHVVDVPSARYIVNISAFAAIDKERLAPDGAEGAHGRIDPARKDALRAFKFIHFPSPIRQNRARDR